MLRIHMRSLALASTIALICFAVPQLPAQEMRIPDINIGIDSPVTAIVLLTHDQPAQGFQTALTYQNSILEFIDAGFMGLDLETLLLPETVEFFLVNNDPDIAPGIGWAATGCVFDIMTPFAGQTLPPGTDQSIVAYTFDAPGGAVGTCTPLQLINGLGTPPINNIVTVNGQTVLPTLTSGEVCFVIHEFRRGDADANGTFNGLVDALYVLDFQFSGGPPPPCMDAADFDDDGTVNGLVEGLLMLGFQFSGGPPPAPPGLTCGLDTTDDSLGCAIYDSCP